MRVYTIHLRPRSAAPDRDAVLVKEGFSWPAFFFGPLWALAHGMWLAAIAFFAIEVVADLACQFAGLHPLGATAVGLGVAIAIGMVGNDLHRRTLARRGWRAEGLVAAAGHDAALRRWFDIHPPRTA